MLQTEHNFERVKDGELAFHLNEYDEMNDGTAIRWQEIMVLHKNKPCRHFEPLGPSTAYSAGPIKILATVMTDHKIELAGDTAGDLRAHADTFRASNFMSEVQAEKAEKSTLLEDFHKFHEMKRKLAQTHSRSIKNLQENALAI